MGYETRYWLETRLVKPHDKAEYPDPITAPPQHGLIPLLRRENDQARSAFNDFGQCWGELKWYDHEEDLAQFSFRFPGVLFILSGRGDNSDDLWRKYFYEGRMQITKARFVYDPPNHDRLNLPDDYRHQAT